MTETRFWYRDPKPKSNYRIGIGAEILFSEIESFFFKKIKKIQVRRGYKFLQA